MSDVTGFFVGLDIHKDSITVAAAATGREKARFLGTVGADRVQLRKMLRRIDPAAALRVVYETGPSGCGLWRELTAEDCRLEVIAPSTSARRSHPGLFPRLTWITWLAP